jgi:cytochrome c oxidase subunit 2
MFSGPTKHVETVDAVMFYIVAIAVVLLLGITVTMIYFVFKYNRKKGHEPVDIHGSIVLETIWVIIPTLLVLSMFYYGFKGYIELRTYPENSMEINVTARQWDWTFKYANGIQTDTLYIPQGQPIKLLMESVDVNHSFFVPAFRIKEDVIAGKINTLGFTADETGDYDIACAEYCGLKHSMMYTKIVVMPEKEFNDWYSEEGTEKK